MINVAKSYRSKEIIQLLPIINYLNSHFLIIIFQLLRINLSKPPLFWFVLTNYIYFYKSRLNFNQIPFHKMINHLNIQWDLSH